MAKNNKSLSKKQSLSRKNILRLAVLGVILFLGTGIAGGVQMYRQSLNVYRESSNSYCNMLYYQIGLHDINEILSHEKDICEIQDAMIKFLEDKYGTGKSYKEICDEFGEERMHVYEEWGDIDSFVVGFGNICRDILYAYVVIPTEEDLIYVWDSELGEGGMTNPFEHIAYTAKEKEHIMAAMRGDVTEDFFTEIVDGELLGTSLVPIWDYDGKIRAVAAIDISISSIQSAFLKLLFNIGIVVLLIMIISITIYHHIVQKQIIDPIVTLTEEADGLVNNLQKEESGPLHIDVHTGDEIDVLARSFEAMDAKLLDYIRENAAITAEKERIGTELALATRIQKGMLPSIFPAFPERKEFDLYASMSPAKEVGGDFYDFFMIDQNHLALVIADVSGKGIPAALFMMMSKIMVQNFALTMDGPAEVLEKVNDQICRNTGEEMFVTVWLGVLDIETGLLTAANAGHEYPFLKTPGGEFELFKDKHGFVIGGMEGFRYKEYQLQLLPGSRLFVYTDGLPEATDNMNRMFGTERTLEALNEVKEAPAAELLRHVSHAAAAFAGSAPQFDDTTMLCLDYFGIR